MTKVPQTKKGFTIIEVLIVLAIAGLILLIVFLAVPALQRNSRNTQRNSEAALIAGAVNECMGNRNGVVGSCDSVSTTEVQLDTTRLTQLSTSPTFSTSNTAPASGTSGAGVWFNRACSADGSTTAAGTSTRQFVVVYSVEGTGNNSITRCLAS